MLEGVNKSEIAELYERLIHVPLGRSTPHEQVIAYFQGLLAVTKIDDLEVGFRLWYAVRDEMGV